MKKYDKEKIYTFLGLICPYKKHFSATNAIQMPSDSHVLMLTREKKLVSKEQEKCCSLSTYFIYSYLSTLSTNKLSHRHMAEQRPPDGICCGNMLLIVYRNETNTNNLTKTMVCFIKQLNQTNNIIITTAYYIYQCQ